MSVKYCAGNPQQARKYESKFKKTNTISNNKNVEHCK